MIFLFLLGVVLGCAIGWESHGMWSERNEDAGQSTAQGDDQAEDDRGADRLDPGIEGNRHVVGGK